VVARPGRRRGGRAFGLDPALDGLGVALEAVARLLQPGIGQFREAAELRGDFLVALYVQRRQNGQDTLSWLGLRS